VRLALLLVQSRRELVALGACGEAPNTCH